MKPIKDCIFIQARAGYSDPNLRAEINLQSTETNGVQDEQLVNCGFTPVVLSKLFGPTVFADLRIRCHVPGMKGSISIDQAEAEGTGWIIERQHWKESDKPDEGKIPYWKEVIRIPAQLEGEFDND